MQAAAEGLRPEHRLASRRRHRLNEGARSVLIGADLKNTGDIIRRQLDLVGQRPRDLHALVRRQLGDERYPELGRARRHRIGNARALRAVDDLGLHLLGDAHPREQALEIRPRRAAGFRIDIGDRLRCQQRALERVHRRQIGRCGAARLDADAHQRADELVRVPSASAPVLLQPVDRGFRHHDHVCLLAGLQLVDQRARRIGDELELVSARARELGADLRHGLGHRAADEHSELGALRMRNGKETAAAIANDFHIDDVLSQGRETVTSFLPALHDKCSRHNTVTPPRPQIPHLRFAD